MKYTKEKTGPYHTSFSHSLCHCITDSFLPIDIQPVLFVIYARFLYHYGITTLSLATWIGNRHSAYTYLHINILQIKTNNKHQIPISANHSIILCKNGYKIGKTGQFLLSGTVLQLPDTPMLPSLTPGCTGSLHPDVKDGNMGVFTELSACFC